MVCSAGFYVRKQWEKSNLDLLVYISNPPGLFGPFGTTYSTWRGKGFNFYVLVMSFFGLWTTLLFNSSVRLAVPFFST